MILDSASRQKSVSPRFHIVDEAADYIVVDKPALLLTHPTKPDQRTTLWKELRELLAFEIANGGQVSIVNRLDRETSGLVLVAKNSKTARRFGLLLQERRLSKEYLAIARGWPKWENKTVDSPMDRQGKYQPSTIWLKQMIHPGGAEAITEFHVERRFVRLNPNLHRNPLPQGRETKKIRDARVSPLPQGKESTKRQARA